MLGVLLSTLILENRGEPEEDLGLIGEKTTPKFHPKTTDTARGIDFIGSYFFNCGA